MLPECFCNAASARVEEIQRFVEDSSRGLGTNQGREDTEFGCIYHETKPVQTSRESKAHLSSKVDFIIRACRWSAIPPLTHIVPSGNQTLDNIGNGESPINGQLQWQNICKYIYVTYVTCKSCWPHARRTATTSASTDQLRLPLAMASEGSKDEAMWSATTEVSWIQLGTSLGAIFGNPTFFPNIVGLCWFDMFGTFWNYILLTL